MNVKDRGGGGQEEETREDGCSDKQELEDMVGCGDP